MNWDTYQRVSTRHMLYKQAISSSRYQPDIEISDEVFYSGIERYLAANLYRDKLPTHPRRTLDQSYYFSLDDTSKRDADQTISKWTGHELPPDGRDSAAPDSLMIMVDQLWCWVLNDRVVVSCFPSGTSESCALDFTGLYSRMTKSWNECDSIWSLYSTLVKEATTHIFQQENKKFLDLVETYRWVVSKKAANQINHFNDFHDTHSSSRFDAEALDDRQELRSVLDVADILDELKMIQSLIYEQREVIKSFAIALTKFQPSQGSPDQDVNNVLRAERITASHDSKVYIFQVINQDNSRLGDTIKLIAQRISEPMRTMIVATDEILDSIYNQIEAVRKDAEYTHQQLLNLLDLKQKTAALAEARATTQQGRAIMLFTIVTIIFLPLSFFTSYFGQNVSDITGDDDNPTSLELWRYGAPISVAIILLALAIAGAIAWPHRFLWLRFGMRA
ncbi:hypothetical protein F5B22DRAFT_16968 [Xylaria bambusicola]|uniref:uncharacterized protein n=1 Tax=Xylaria bambusicola TaxID=326684 RepID=UPI002007ED00|nr:uncharacterized protein F5B22DRAFT_16968 [Xylaria bambusicola]KAI0528046.1 hypothetical protein F5B22DRAFT_16968 [Xylaria bambusicola]